ncbi:L-histidine N(alpha)-methyltransferase [Oleiagrimonas sp. C23AA]|uniref:L-histidine N(alpha)-methyltransferase n=1 Tax=Oleiagrimonas sp. C23AA TaxID=2719047 RepID=UPI0014234491|nr:L-histidine N(alpha)-methyltransferase [Oleiagrimonas sp. C23AA]NII09077.1 L-histidine N(alpha)-methyltransferase [Oleiagrimonas sp. C23AA]
MSSPAYAVRLHDLHPSPDDIRGDVLDGLSRQPKRLSSKYFYDAHGSALFEQICEQPEYYLTRTELAIMRAHIGDIARALGPRVELVEYGSGSGIKTRMLLQHLDDPVGYVPVEISRSALMASVERLGQMFANVEMLPVCADFTEAMTLPRPSRARERAVIYFPGSTIGNFDARDAAALLRIMRAEMGEDGAALIGVDLVKEPAVIEAAYNDKAGITAAFTLNMLRRFNDELGADFDLDGFRHRAQFNPMAERIETHIVSQRFQDVHIDGRTFHFEPNEAMLVEYSCKYSQASFARLAARASLRVTHSWTDPERMFALQCLERAPE